jgi:hyperosmotically inducible protein
MKKQIGMTVIVAASAFVLVPSAGAQFAQPLGSLAQAAIPDKDAAATKSAVDDREIMLRVKAALAKDKEIAALTLFVKAVEGNVILTGTAHNKAQADRVAQIARTVPGVKSVTNEIRVI